MTNPRTDEALDAVPRRSRGRPPNLELRNVKHSRMLDAAFSLFTQNGYDQVTVEEIARGSSQSKGAFYWYFKDKEDCLRQVLQEKTRQLEDMLTEVVLARPSAREQLMGIADFEQWVGQDLFQIVVLLNHMQHCSSSVARDTAKEIEAQWIHGARRMLCDLGRKAANEQGWFREKVDTFDFESWSLCCLASCEGLLHRAQQSPETMIEPRRLTATFRSIFLEPFLNESK